MKIYIGFIFIFVVFMSSMGRVQSEGTVDGARSLLNTLELAKKVQNSYAETLHLKNKNFTDAMKILFVNGFECRVGKGDKFLDVPKNLACQKYPSGIDGCQDLQISLYDERGWKDVTTHDFIKRLPDIYVASINTLCFMPPDDVDFDSYLERQVDANKELYKYIENNDLLQPRNANFENLIENNFICSIIDGSIISVGDSITKIKCRPLRAKIDYCYRPTIVVEKSSISTPVYFKIFANCELP